MGNAKKGSILFAIDMLAKALAYEDEGSVKLAITQLRAVFE